MDPFASLLPAYIPRQPLGAKLSEQTIRELAQAALAARELAATCAIDSDESTSRVTFTIAGHGGELRRTTRFSADADPDLVAALIRKAVKRLARDLRGGRIEIDAGRHHSWEH